MTRLSRSTQRDRWSARLRSALLLCCCALFAAEPLYAVKPEIDEPAPDFALKSSSGKNVRLSEYRGDVVLVNFWTRSCSRCREQLDQIDRLRAEFQDAGFSVVSVAITDDPHHVQDIVNSLKLGFPILYDVEKRAARLYDPSSIPLTMLIDPHGDIRQIYKKYRRGDEDTYREQIEALLSE